MKKFNLSQIMKDAWSFYRAGGRTFSESLKAAWAGAKALAHKIVVKNWFLNKEFTSGERYAIRFRTMLRLSAKQKKQSLLSGSASLAQLSIGFQSLAVRASNFKQKRRMNYEQKHNT